MKCNLKIVDYLYLTLYLDDGTYHLFHKPNEETTYMHIESDHSPQIIKNIPRSIEKRKYLQQRKYLKIWKITMSSAYDNAVIAKN